MGFHTPSLTGLEDSHYENKGEIMALKRNEGAALTSPQGTHASHTFSSQQHVNRDKNNFNHPLSAEHVENQRSHHV